MSVEIEAWETPFETGNLHILSVAYEGIYSTEVADGREYDFNDLDDPVMGTQLIVRIFNSDDETIYRVNFRSIGAYRVTDRLGLTEDYLEASDEDEEQLRNTFRIKNHRLARPSSEAFDQQVTLGWSYVILSDFDNVEVVAHVPPTIDVEGKVSSSTRSIAADPAG